MESLRLGDDTLRLYLDISQAGQESGIDQSALAWTVAGWTLTRPTLLSLLDRDFVLGPWFCYIAGGLLTLAGLVRVVTLRPFHLNISENGVTVRSDSLTATTPWSAIAAITVERQPGSPATMSPAIVLWPADGSELMAKARYKRNDRRGYELVVLDELIETAEQVIAVLRQYAGDKFVLVDAPVQRVRRS